MKGIVLISALTWLQLNGYKFLEKIDKTKRQILNSLMLLIFFHLILFHILSLSFSFSIPFCACIEWNKQGSFPWASEIEKNNQKQQNKKKKILRSEKTMLKITNVCILRNCFYSNVRIKHVSKCNLVDLPFVAFGWHHQAAQ